MCVSLSKNIFIIIHVSGFPRWRIVMRGQTFGRGAQVYLYKCYIFIDKITTVMTASVYIKYISEFKIIRNSLSQ